MRVPAVTTPTLDHPVATDCPNCGATVSGNFCHACGQETVLHPPSAREFVHEFIGHYVALEGRLWKTLWLLLFRPGMLTLEYLRGRRVRYVQPLRLYLTLSLVFFALMKFDSVHMESDTGRHAGPSTVTPDGDRRGARRAQGDVWFHEDKPGELNAWKQSVRGAVSAVNPHLADKVVAFLGLPLDDRERLMTGAFYSYAPYAIFFMMPLFALYLKILYLGSGRPYGAHLLFALHANAFAFLTMILMLLVREVAWLWPVNLVAWIWLVLYLPAAMRRVYGGRRIATGLRWIVLMVLHLVTIGLAIVGAVAYGSLH